MSTETKDTIPGCGVPSAEEIALTRDALAGAKLRPYIQITVLRDSLRTKNWPIIQAWAKERRQYMTLSIGDVWRYESVEARDAVLAQLRGES